MFNNNRIHFYEDDPSFHDKDSFINNLMNTYTKNVYLIAYSYVKDKGIAEDISQEVFLKCYKYFENFRGEASIKTWIYRITVNTAKDFINKKSYKLLQLPTIFLEHRRKGESTEETYINKTRNENLLKIVHSIPIKYREVILLHYYHELKIEEIGETLEININTVKTRLSRGRAILRKKLDSKKGEIPNG